MTSEVHESLSGEPESVRRTVAAIAHLLLGASRSATTADAFVSTSLGVSSGDVVCATELLTVSTRPAVAAILADDMSTWNPPVGPAEDSCPPTWERTEIDGTSVSLPKELAVFFVGGSFAPIDVVVCLREASFMNDEFELRIYTRTVDAEAGRALLAQTMTAARGPRNFFRGRVLQATAKPVLGLAIVDLPRQDRSNLVLPAEVWNELDTNIAAVTTRADLMRQLGLGTSRGVLLTGPPGVGKSAVSRVVAGELMGDATVIIVDALAGSRALRSIYEETRYLGRTVVILEDLDLIIGTRGSGGRNELLAEFLTVLDGTRQYDDVLTIASTNDPTSLDSAATRSARFDAIIEIDYPDTAATAEILRRILTSIPGADAVDCHTVARSFASAVSGADVRETVRRAVLEHGTAVTTQVLLRTIADGRWRAAELTGQYL